MTSHSCSAVLWTSHLRLIRPQLKWASRKMGAAWLQRGKTPKSKVLRPRINILGLKNSSFLEIAMVVARKATEPQTAGKGVNCSLCLHLQAKTALEMTNQFPNKEIDFAKEYLWRLNWFWLGVRS